MKHLKVLFVFLAVTMILVQPAWGQSLQDHLKKANAAYKSKNFEGAITELRAALKLLKEGGNPAGAQQIQMNIGINFIKLNKFEEAVKELEEAKALYKKPDPKIDIKLNSLLATAHYRLGHYAIRAAILEGLLKKYKQMDDKTKANMLAQLADSYRRNEIHSQAVGNYQQALKLQVKLKNQERQALILTATGLSQAKLGDFKGALDSLEKALELAKAIGRPLSLAETYSNMGIVNWDQGEYPKALELITLAKEIEAKHDLKQNLGADFNNEGLIYKSAGNYPQALASINEAIRIAREIKDRRSEAIALSNRALIYRITGKNQEAFQDYHAALKIYESVKFLEGTASCHLGLGKLYEVRDHDYIKAYDHYLKALELYEKLGNLTYQAESYNQIGRVLKATVNPERASRDLIFEEDEPETLQMSPEEAAAKSLEAYQKALELATKVGKKEAVWSAQQGIGYALRAQSKDEEAFKYYKAAVDTVVSIKGGGSDSELMANYLNDKEDLFVEAIELLTDLYAKTKKQEYLRLKMEYQEIYKNEVMKVALNGARLQFDDQKKQGLMDQIKKSLAKKEKLDQVHARQQDTLEAPEAKGTDQAEQEQLKKDVAKDNGLVVKEAKKLDGSIKQLLAQWKKKYPGDSGMFDSSAKVDLKTLNSTLGPDEALVQYFPMHDRLSILVVTKKDVQTAEVAIPYEKLAELIRDKFTYKVIELYGHSKTDMSEEEAYDFSNQVLHELYKVLLEPVADAIKDKKRLIVVPSKYISYVPFSALVTGFDGKEPRFLIYDKTVSYIRLSFFHQVFGKKKKLPFGQNKLIAVGNPVHMYLKAGLGNLPGAEKEIRNAIKVAQEKKLKVTDAVYKEEATESAWKKQVGSQAYTIFYFATHGVPYAEIMHDRRATIGPFLEKMKARVAKTTDPKKKARYEKRVKSLEGFEKFCEETFMSKSPLNGFLYMSFTGKEDDDGVLTLKEILQVPDSVFKAANLAVLSACNTAVTYSPKVDDKVRKETESAEINKELMSAGWTPGVDQVCLTDTFMKRNFNSVMGTLWFADDAATGFIIARFFENLEKHEPAEALRQAKLAYLEKPPMGPDYTKVPKHAYYWAVSAIFGK